MTKLTSFSNSPKPPDDSSPFYCCTGRFLTFFLSLLFTCSFWVFSLLYCHFPQLFLLIEKLPSFFAQPKNPTSKNCQRRKIKSGKNPFPVRLQLRKQARKTPNNILFHCISIPFSLGFTVWPDTYKKGIIAWTFRYIDLRYLKQILLGGLRCLLWCFVTRLALQTPSSLYNRACRMTKVWCHIHKTRVSPLGVKKNPKKNFSVENRDPTVALKFAS